ncbi:phosphotransferase family protein [Arthroderma uncinatum]|uniref:phosphotransferase family protein n=1 Tax=Arthroderma uncinatum TaxID=74035 RepID=UPI00144A5A48|nr:phosphotransferase family protein [Arthroderma uncinatum]KAF3492260.1 phosphotransferase family protein [Arthroderma uncinatum]
MYVHKSTNIPVPKVYALYDMNDVELEMNYMVMEYIEGQTLESCWATLTDPQKEDIATTLKEYFVELRSLPSPGYYGSLGRRPFENLMFETMEPNPAVNDPFETEKGLNEGMVLNYASRKSKYRAEFRRRALATTFLIHADLKCKNIIVKENEREVASSDTKRMYQVTLIDWEAAGWHPSY